VVTYRFGPFQLVPDQRRLERDGTAIPLTPRAFDLLVALVQHRTRALSKDEILALVWSGSVVEEGNLAQQVLLLRPVPAIAWLQCHVTAIASWHPSARSTRTRTHPRKAHTASSGTDASIRFARALP
jgi:hypothetical protein